MPIRATCSCGKTFNAPSQYAGKKVKCPDCKQPVTIPAAAATEKKKSTSAEKVAVRCKCGKSLQAKVELIGKTVKCPSCSEPLQIQPAAEKSAAKKATDSLHSLLDDVGMVGDTTSGRKCPECRAPMSEEAIICIDCGYNEKLGRKMTVQRPRTAADRSSQAGKRSRG